jgi:hypothetical protein
MVAGTSQCEERCLSESLEKAIHNTIDTFYDRAVAVVSVIDRRVSAGAIFCFLLVIVNFFQVTIICHILRPVVSVLLSNQSRLFFLVAQPMRSCGIEVAAPIGSPCVIPFLRQLLMVFLAL